ncbi:HSF-type DNA-binding-domain-containing protein [Mycena polygramma]|nr:HSF-type DNA-binding-domain-containing protein [Mycena polygramma]
MNEGQHRWEPSFPLFVPEDQLRYSESASPTIQDWRPDTIASLDSERDREILDRNGNDAVAADPGSTVAASGFVKKLYNTLGDPDPAVQNIICWGPDGLCFLVKDVNEFAKAILPGMYKHSNFASFVRQLNKYGFHKVRSLEEYQSGEEIWTFRHPKFRAGDRDALDNIKRKAPGQRRRDPTDTTVMFCPDNHTSTALIGSIQAELSSLGAAHENVLSHVHDLERNYDQVLATMAGFRRYVSEQDGLMGNLVRYCSDVDGTIQPQRAEGANWAASQVLDMQQTALSGSDYDEDEMVLPTPTNPTDLERGLNDGLESALRASMSMFSWSNPDAEDGRSDVFARSNHR